MSAPPDSYVIELLELEPVLRAYLRRCVSAPMDAEDLLQEALVRLLALPAQRRSQLKSVRAFALTTARNLVVDWLRHRRVVPMQAVEDFADWDVLDEQARLEEIVNARQELQAVERAIARLPRGCRQIFLLKRVQGLSQREIAGALGISESTVEGQLVKALKGLTALLGRDRAGRGDTAGRHTDTAPRSASRRLHGWRS